MFKLILFIDFIWKSNLTYNAQKSLEKDLKSLTLACTKNVAHYVTRDSESKVPIGFLILVVMIVILHVIASCFTAEVRLKWFLGQTPYVWKLTGVIYVAINALSAIKTCNSLLFRDFLLLKLLKHIINWWLLLRIILDVLFYTFFNKCI